MDTSSVSGVRFYLADSHPTFLRLAALEIAMKLHQTLGLTALVAAVALAGCAQPMRRDSPPPGSPPGSPTLEVPTSGSVDATAPNARRSKPRMPPRPQPPAGNEELPVTPAEPAREDTGEIRAAGSLTGVPVCDRYLASFKQCHTTIGQSAPTQIDERYDRLRATLTRKSGTPEGRAEISRSCKDYAANVATALGDRKCGDPSR